MSYRCDLYTFLDTGSLKQHLMFIVLQLLLQNLDPEAQNNNPTRQSQEDQRPGTEGKPWNWGERNKFKAGLGSPRPCSDRVRVGKRIVQLFFRNIFQPERFKKKNSG